MSTHNAPNDALDILFEASDEMISLAADVGIDGMKLLNALPASGQRLTGYAVPTLHKKYKGTCSIIFHINETKDGTFWPLLKFHTFKHGGIETTFNGLTWLNENRAYKNNSHTSTKPKRVNNVVNMQSKEQAEQQQIQEDLRRLERFVVLCEQFESSHAITFDHPWLKERLYEYATPVLTARLNLKVKGNELLLPLIHDQNGHIGFQKIIINQNNDKKRNLIKKQGLLNGSYIKINANPAFPFLPIALCEGVATALSVALVWPGEIRIALSADNIKKVRAHIKGAVVIFNDEDVWKDGVDNVGLNAAFDAKKEGDIICSPVFSCQSYDQKPTDFNDLLMIDGYDALSKQIGVTLIHCLESSLKNSSAPVTVLYS